ncbi:S8 family serine peptidase [Xanthomonas prunicola]|uniref:S8 family serine peptidase n=1 Tax=Xanthomonas prunicola TaxID=2053930 RepID=UPI0020791B64|nr:S8 family serine peptidase [Xanthomonas prunicola]USJ01115.1 S8 family serine peptidase [Xanthomonas prunicola]
MAKIRGTRWCWLALLAVGQPVSAQLALPSVGGLANDVTQAVPPLSAAPDRALQQAQGDLRRLRRLRLDALVRARPRDLDRDADGAIVMRGQIVALAPSPAALQTAQTAGFVVAEQRGFDALGLRVVVLRAPSGLATQQAMQRLRQLDPQGEYVYNHLYSESQAGEAPAVQAPAGSAQTDAAAGFRVGLIDSGVDAAHPALVGVQVQRWGCDGRARPQVHGTAVASLLAGRAVTHGPIARTLYAADLYCGTSSDGAAVELVAALAWMAQQGVAVINISLVGAPNRLLERAVAALVARGHLLVAAVGNDGPAAPPLYPASYPGVIGVTAVDTRLRVLPEAGRGTQVVFAAIGDIIAAAPQGQWRRQRGTSSLRRWWRGSRRNPSRSPILRPLLRCVHSCKAARTTLVRAASIRCMATACWAKSSPCSECRSGECFLSA